MLSREGSRKFKLSPRRRVDRFRLAVASILMSLYVFVDGIPIFTLMEKMYAKIIALVGRINP